MASLSYFRKCELTERVDDVGACFDAYLDRIQERNQSLNNVSKADLFEHFWNGPRLVQRRLRKLM